MRKNILKKNLVEKDKDNLKNFVHINSKFRNQSHNIPQSQNMPQFSNMPFGMPQQPECVQQ